MALGVTEGREKTADPAVLAAPEVPEALEVLAALAALVVEVPA